jgi:branched-chain amino acid transport system ATP-binding protein
MGMTRTFQIVQPFAAQTVRENIAVGAHLHLPSRAAVAHWRLAEVGGKPVSGLTPQLDKLARRPHGGWSQAAGAGACAWPRGPRLLLLDEVLAGLNPQEIAEMIPVVRSQKHCDATDSGVRTTVLMIEHVMQAVMNLGASRSGCWRKAS